MRKTPIATARRSRRRCGRRRLQQAGTPAAAPRHPPPNDKAEPAEGAARIAIAPDGVHVQYRVYGSGEPALVFIHGWSCDSNYWREQIPAFKQEIHAGHRGSRRPRRHRRQSHRLEHRALRRGRGDRARRPCLTSRSSSSATPWAARWPSKPRACSRAASSASSASTPSSRSARRSPSKAQVDAAHQAFRSGLHRSDARARRRSPVRQGLQSAARAEDRLRHVAVAAARRGALDARAARIRLHRAAQGHLGAHRRHQLRSRRARERGAHPQGAAEIPRRHARRRRPLPHDGRSAALQSRAGNGSRRA